MAFLWVKQQRDNIQAPIKHKPVYSRPFRPETFADLYKGKEGFQTSAQTVVSGAPQAVLKGSGSGSGSSSGSVWPSQFDLSPREQALYGKWEKTSFDTYYDYYELAESDAAGNQLLKFNDIEPAPSVPPDFGSSLGAFDSDTTRIPWDKDNESYQQTDIVWGYVSEQASRSIFLKTYVNELAANANSFIPCSEENPTNYCYKSPLFDVNVNDRNLAYVTKTGEAVTQAAGTLPMMYLSEIDMNMKNLSEIYEKRKKAIGNFLDSVKSKTSHVLGQVKTFTTPVGNALALGVGARKTLASIKNFTDKIAASARAVLNTTRATASTVTTIATSTVTGAAVASAGAALLNPAAAPVAAVLAWVAVGVDLFFGVFGGICMAIEAIVDPMMAALLNTGGDCPDNYKPITELVPTPVLTALSSFLPLAPFLQMFDPYVCWGKDSNGLANVRLKIPPKVPPFMSDRTLSLVYHAAWQTGNNPAIPSPTSLSFMLDPLPPGYVWLEQSDLANTPNVNELTQYARSAAMLGKGSNITPPTNNSQDGSGKLPSNIAVKTCEQNTVPSLDGRRCNKKEIKTTSKLPSLASCGSSRTDDGYNCWNVKVDPSCTGGEIQYTTTQTWSDATGYFRVTTTPRVCNGVTQPENTNTNIGLSYQQRITCEQGYENITPELLCFAKCPTGFIRKGAICSGVTESYDRQYMFGTSTMYRQQTFDPKILNDIADVKIPYCDFSKPYMLNKMGQFYYKNSLQNPLINEDGTIQIQMITKFFGVIASSELSCDVVCAIEFITYDPITGGNYSSYTGCSYPDDEEYKLSSFCYRRFYFIRRGDETNFDEFTVTGCTWVDYTALDAMVKSSDIGTNLVQSLPKNLKIHRKDASIINYARFNNEWKSGAIMARAGAGLLQAGISIAGGMLGMPAGGLATKIAASNAVKGATKNLVEEAAKGGAKVSEEVAADTASSILTVLKTGGDDATEQALKVANASNITGKQAEDLVALMQKNIKNGDVVEQRTGMGVGLLGGVGAGLFTSMYLDAELEKTAARRLPPEDVDGAANTFITGKDKYNLQVATNNNWWTINHGAIYELAEGHIPTINFCEGVKIPYSYCTYKYAVRDMVHKYHNENERKHIKEILAIEPRGENGCYYKWNEVDYDPDTNIEQTILKEKEIILAHTIADYSTCTFKPTRFDTNVNNEIYSVRSYIDPSTNSLPNPRIIYPTRNTVYTSDLFARYVRVRQPESAATRGSGDGVLNLAQLSVFDVSGFNVSVQMPVYATSAANGAATADTVVNGTSDQTDMLSTVWQPASTDANPYLEVDLEKLVNISQVIYFGGTFDQAKFRNKGVRIQFLYTNGANDAPIYTYTLPTDDSIQLVPMYSSSYTAPTFPIAGPIKIPRPIAPGKVLGVEFGCMNRCEDKGVIDSLVQQYNNTSSGSTIIKVLRAITANSTTCEYEAEVVKTDVNAGSSAIAKNSITKQILSMQISPSVKQGYGAVLARYIKITPNNVPGTVLEFSKIIVRNTVRPGSSNYGNNQHTIVSDGKNISVFNTFHQLTQIYCTKSPSSSVCTFDATKMRFLMEPPNNYNNDYTTINPEAYPRVWKAGDNQAGTFFVVDLAPPGADPTQNGNYEIYDIVIIGAADRTPGGLRGVKIELFLNRQGDQDNATNSGIYEPTRTYYLPSDDVKQRILVEPPSKCEFVLSNTEILKLPTFLQEKSGDLSTVDTSGGVFSFSTVLDSVKSAWNSLLPTSPTDMVAPIKNNLKASNEIVHQMLETISANKTILNSTKKCSDPDILKTMMTAYNIKKGASVTGEFSLQKNTMMRILKAGQSTPSTCDVLFDNLEEYYEDYMQDITNKADIKKSVKAARFKFVTTNKPNVPVAPDMTSIEYDINSNALGIMSDSSLISPVYAGPSCKVDCSNLVQIKAIANVKNTRSETTTKIVSSAYVQALQTFQGSPLSCEYKMLKATTTTNKVTNKTVISDPVYTYVKAIFTLDTDGCTPLLSSVQEYDPDKVTYSNDYLKSYLDGIEVTLPNLFWYNPSKLVSTRVDSTVKNIS